MVPFPGTVLQRPITMGDTQERRATRASMASEQQAAGSSEGRGDGKEFSLEDFVRNSFAAMGTKLDTLIAGQAALERKVNSLETKVNSNTTQFTDIIKSVDFESNKSQDNANQIQEFKIQLQQREAQLDSASYTISSMTSDLNSLERYTRLFNFRILGLPESKGENCIDSVRQILKDKFDIEAPVIENAHRVGISRGDKRRQMIAGFYSPATSRNVISSREWLRNTGMRFVDDLTQKDLEEKMRIKPMMDKLYYENKRPRFINGRLYGEGRAVSRETINSFLATLPASASPNN